MSPKEMLEACVKWSGLVPTLIGLSVAIVSASAWMIQVHAESTHKDHPTRNEYDQVTRLLIDRLDRIENKIDRLETSR